MIHHRANWTYFQCLQRATELSQIHTNTLQNVKSIRPQRYNNTNFIGLNVDGHYADDVGNISESKGNNFGVTLAKPWQVLQVKGHSEFSTEMIQNDTPFSQSDRLTASSGNHSSRSLLISYLLREGILHVDKEHRKSIGRFLTLQNQYWQTMLLRARLKLKVRNWTTRVSYDLASKKTKPLLHSCNFLLRCVNWAIVAWHESSRRVRYC